MPTEDYLNSLIRNVYLQESGAVYILKDFIEKNPVVIQDFRTKYMTIVLEFYIPGDFMHLEDTLNNLEVLDHAEREIAIDRVYSDKIPGPNMPQGIRVWEFWAEINGF